MDLELTPEEQRLLDKDDKRTERVGYWMVLIFGPLLVATGIVGMHAITWLQSGAWPAFTLGDVLDRLGFGHVRSSWVGTQMIIDWIKSCPVAGTLPLVSAATVMLFTRNDDIPDSEALRVARMKRARSAINSVTVRE